MDAWKIVKEFIEKKEEQFMEFLEDEHEIEGSDWPSVTRQVEEAIGYEEG